jgi:phage-related baseplate assembly protein
MSQPIELSNLPAPEVVETFDFETILADMIADLQSRDPSFSALVESDPAFKILEIAAYRETMIRQRINEGAKAVLLGYSTGGNLENLAALFGVSRLPNETDTALRSRTQLALEGFSTAGPVGAYEFHALSVPGVKDVSILSPNPGEVLISVLSSSGNGAADSGLLTAVETALNADNVRPLTDQITVQSATIHSYTIIADVYTFDGPDPALVLNAVNSAVNQLVSDSHKLGRDVALSAIYAALHQPGVSRVVLSAPVADTVIDEETAAFCSSISIINAGVSE